MLASTVKFSKYNRHPTPTRTTFGHRQGPHPEETEPAHTPQRGHVPGPILQDPTTCQAPPLDPTTFHCPHPRRDTSLYSRSRHQGRRQLIDVPPLSTRCPTLGDRPGSGTQTPGAHAQMLLRKEVIQPHLPVRLPCYDLVPIASPTFDGSPHKGWATGFGCYRLS